MLKSQTSPLLATALAPSAVVFVQSLFELNPRGATFVFSVLVHWTELGLEFLAFSPVGGCGLIDIGAVLW